MSLHEYQLSLEIVASSPQPVPFYALIMAAMRQGDTENVEKLKHAWPSVWRELRMRYNAPGGLLFAEALKSAGCKPMGVGMQIAYIPLHAEGDLHHEDVELGFVTSSRGSTAFCRYWRKGELGTLRTLANSESTPMNRLIPYSLVPQEYVDKLIDRIESGDRFEGGV